MGFVYAICAVMFLAWFIYAYFLLYLVYGVAALAALYLLGGVLYMAMRNMAFWQNVHLKKYMKKLIAYAFVELPKTLTEEANQEMTRKMEQVDDMLESLKGQVSKEAAIKVALIDEQIKEL